MAFFRKTTAAIEAVDTVKRSAAMGSYSVADPALADYLGIGGRNDAGVAVTEQTALGLTAVYRAVAIISSTIAGLPLKSYRELPDGQKERVASFLDNPGGQFLTPYEFKQLVLVHLLLHGNAYLLHGYNGAGVLDYLIPLHPSMVSVDWDDNLGRVYRVSAAGIERVYSSLEITHIMGMGTDGLKGLSPISVARNAIGTGIAGDQAAARMFSGGLLIGGLVTPKEDMDEDQANAALAGLKAKLTGTQNAGDLVLINAALDVQPWTMTSEDAQFIQTRQYQVNDIARLYGVPKVLLAEDGASTWGTGIGQLLQWMSRTTLMGYTTAIEERLSRLLIQSNRYCEFDYKGLLQPSPEIEIDLIIKQKDAGLITTDEARELLGRSPLPSTNTTPQQDAGASPEE